MPNLLRQSLALLAMCLVLLSPFRRVTNRLTHVGGTVHHPLDEQDRVFLLRISFSFYFAEVLLSNVICPTSPPAFRSPQFENLDVITQKCLVPQKKIVTSFVQKSHPMVLKWLPVLPAEMRRQSPGSLTFDASSVLGQVAAPSVFVKGTQSAT